MRKVEFRRDRIERERRGAAQMVEEAVEADIAEADARDASAGWADLTQEEADALVARVAPGSGEALG